MDFDSMTDDELRQVDEGYDPDIVMRVARMSGDELRAISEGFAPQAVENGAVRAVNAMSMDQLRDIAEYRPETMASDVQPKPQEQEQSPAPSRKIVGRVDAQMAPGQFASEEQMGGATQAALENQAKYGIAGEAAEDDGSVANWAKNVGTTAANNSFGRITATDTIANAQALLRGEVNGVKLEDLPDEETDYLVDATGMNGFMSYMSTILPKSWRGARGQMEEWDNTTGARIADPVERKRQRVAWAKGLAQGMIEQNEEAKRLAEAELVGRESNWTSEFTGGLLSNGAYMVPFAIAGGRDKGVIAGIVEGSERFNELRQDKYGVDQDGNIYVEAERDDDLTALGKGTARGVMAPLIEKAGGKVLKPFTYVLGKIPLVKKAGEKIVETTAGKAVNRYLNTLKSFTKLTGMHSFPEEVLEEYEDQVMDAAFGTDRRKSEMGESTMSSRFADAHGEFMKPENLVKLAKSMALIQMVGGGAAHVADARLARYADGMLTKIAGIDEEKLKGYTGEEKAAAFKAWVANMSEDDVEEAFEDGTRSIKELLSAIREKSGNFDFSQIDGVQDENRVFTVPTVQNEKGETVPDFKNVEDSAGRTVRRMTDNASGISIDELTDADGKVSYKARGALGRVRSASTVEEAKNLADQMAKRSALNDRKVAYLNTLREKGRALSGTDVIAGDTLREALDAFGNKYGEEAKRKLMGGEEYQRGYNAKNPSLHYTLDDGSDVVLVNLSGIDNAAQMQNFATHEAITHSGLDMLFSDPKMRAQFLESVGVTGDMGKGDFLSQIDQEAFEKVDKQQFDAVVKAQMRQRGFSSADQVFADDAAREEVMAWVTERLHASPSMKNKVVAAVRKMYRRNFKTDLKFNADEVATMFDALRGMATQREGGELRYRSVEQSAERDKANANAVIGEIRANAEAQPLQLENKALDGEKILMDMQGKAVAATNVDAPSATTDAAQSATDNVQEHGPSVTPVEPATATTQSETTVQQTTTSAPSTADVVQSFKDYSDADLDAYIEGLKQFEMLNDTGKKNLANAEKEKVRRAKAKAKQAETEKKAARKKADAEEKKFKEDDERAFQAWLKRHPGRKDSKAARDDYERDLSGAIADVCRSIANGHGKELPSVHLKAVLRRLADDNAKRWNFKVGDGAFNLEGMLEQMDKAGKLFGEDGLMVLAPFNGMVEQAYPSVRQGAKDKVARRLRAFFGPMWLSHRQAIADKNNASYAGLAQQRSAQARRDLVDRDKNRVNGFVRGYIASHPGTVLEGWHDYWNGERNSADAIEEVYDVERDGLEFDHIMSEMERLAPGTVPLDADGNVDHTQFEKTKQALLNELDRAVAWGEANEAADAAVEAEDVREGAGAEVEGWERIRDERPSWWGKEPWDMTEAEERDFDRYNEESGAADAAAGAEVEELGLSPDETPKGADAMWRAANIDPEAVRIAGPKAEKVFRSLLGSGPAEVRWRTAMEDKDLNLGKMSEHMRRERTVKFADGDEDKTGAESIVVRSGDGETVTKYRDAKDWTDEDVQKIAYHNELFGDATPYTVEGMVDDDGWDDKTRTTPRIVLRQPYVHILNGAGIEARRQLLAAMERRFGAENVTTTGTIDQQYKFSIKAGPYTITDLKDMNIGIDERDGKFRVWDCTIEKDEVGEKKNPDVTDSTSSAGVESQSGVDSPFLGAVRRPSKDQTKTKSSISVDGRFIKTNIRDYKNGDFNVDTSSAESAMRSLSKMLSMRREGGSRYVTYVVEVGSTTVRLSDHNADGRYFVNDPADAYVSVIIGDDVHKDAHSHVPVMEWRYPSATFAENPKAVVDSIVNGVSQIIDGGTFTADQNLAKFNLVEADVSDKDARKYVDEKNEERSKFIRRKGNTDIQWRTYTPYPGLRSMADALGLSTEELDVLMGGSSFIAGRTLRQTMFPTEAALVGAISDEGGAKGVLKSARNLMSELSSPGAKGKWNALLDGLRRRLTDYMLPVLRMEQWIGAKSGSKVGVSESVHDAAKFAFGRQTHMMNTVHQKFLEPLKRLIAANKLNEKSKYVAGNDVLTDILLALHGPAFNRMISERTNGNDLAGSGKSTEFWVDLLRKYGAQGSRRQILAALSAGNYAGLNFAAGSVGEKAADAVAKVMEMNKWTRQLLVDTGRLSAAQRDLWERESPFYVPLRFDMENDQNFMETFFYGKTKDEGIYTRNYTQGESKHAFGHDGVSDSPIAFSIQQCETAIVRATDNEVRAKLAALVRRHAELGEVIDPNDPAQSWKLPTTNVLGQNGKSHTVPDVNGIESKYGNIVAFKEGGNLKFIVLGRRPNAGTATTTNRAEADNLPQKDGELIGRAVKKQTLVEPGNVIRAVRAATRMFGILRTSASPEFLVSNFLADNGQAARNIYADFGFGAAKRFEGFVPKAVMTARRLINGNLGTSVLDRYAQEMQEDGGLIGGLATENFRDIEKQIENDVKLFAGDRKARVIDFLTKLGERLNGPVELSTRIAAYAAVREQLKTDTSKTDKEKRAIAAKYAREVTVDFNQKGEWTPVLNALYAFSNASLVDMERSMGAFLAKKGGRMAIGLFLVGFLSSLVGYWQDNPDDEREGKAQWKDTKDYRKQNQMGFRVGDKYVSMPVRGLSRVCYYAGHKAYEVMAGKTGAVDAGMDMGGFIASNVFDPIGDVTKPAQAITPSVARPAMELVQNESFSGAQIYRQPMDSRQVRSEMGRQSTPSAWHAIARGLNSLTGGNRVRRGLVDVQPEILQHYYSWLTGSAGNDVARATNLVADVARWNFDDMEARNVPFMRRFVGGLDQNSATFRELQDAFKVDMDEYKEIAPTDPDVRMELANRHGYFGDGHRAQRWREELDDLQKAQRNLMKMEMKADGQAKKDIHDLRMKVQAAFIYRTEHAPETDDADRRSFDRSRNRIVDKAIAKNKREEKAAANERERELRRNRIVK